ncbi:hypothetical protein CP556_23785 [Natrinema sp. CBA1119]|nr:hypothetical protein [Natrinema sp. CBA1119]PGF14078.1 hypothetical protein CP556_23785 [Natrinema sp. CBA1119]
MARYVTPSASTAGEKLLAAARGPTGGRGQTASEHHQPAPTRLYDQSGNGIRDESRPKVALEDADDEGELVPAMALTETAGAGESNRQPPSGPTTEYLDC